MKAMIRKTTFILSSTCAIGILGLCVFNSFNVNSNKFMNSKTIALSKRLDEMNGEVKFGRQAASSAGWESLANAPKVVAKKVEKRIIKKKVQKQQQREVKVVKNLNKASIQESLQLEVAQVFNAKLFKNALSAKDGKISGSLSANNGVIESINISLPNGQAIEINTYDEMEGNVFQYESLDGGEKLSGMFYKIKEGSYMVTLTNDKNFAGTRIQFDAPADTNYGNSYDYEKEHSYSSFDNIAENNKDENDDDYYQDDYYQDDYAQNEEAQIDDIQYQEEGLENSENEEDAQNNEEQQSYGFNFNA